VSCATVCGSGTYKVNIDTIEHIERDLQKLRSMTKRLTDGLNKVRNTNTRDY